jgi:hypothetical protein
LLAIYSSEADIKDINKINNDFDETFFKVAEIRIDERYYKTNSRAKVCLKFTPTGIVCYIEYTNNDISYNSAEREGHITYKLRYPGVNDHLYAMDVLNRGVLPYLFDKR